MDKDKLIELIRKSVRNSLAIFSEQVEYAKKANKAL